MINSNIILKEGYKPIFILVIISFILNIFISDFLGTIAIILTLITIYAYRNPARHIFENTQSVLSPIDARVVAIDRVDDDIKIYCKINIFDTHIIRSPFEGELKVKGFKHGLNLNPNTPKAQLLNEQLKLKFLSKDGDSNLKLKLISGFFNPSISKIDEKDVSQGDKVATFLDGLAVITIKQNDLLININDKLKAGQTILFKK